MWFYLENNFKGYQLSICLAYILPFVNLILASLIEGINSKLASIPLIIFAISLMILFITSFILANYEKGILNTYDYEFVDLSTMNIYNEEFGMNVEYLISNYQMSNNEEEKCYNVLDEYSSYGEEDLVSLEKKLIRSGLKKGLKREVCEFIKRINVFNIENIIWTWNIMSYFNMLSIVISLCIILHYRNNNKKRSNKIVEDSENDIEMNFDTLYKEDNESLKQSLNEEKNKVAMLENKIDELRHKLNNEKKYENSNILLNSLLLSKEDEIKRLKDLINDKNKYITSLIRNHNKELLSLEDKIKVKDNQIDLLNQQNKKAEDDFIERINAKELEIKSLKERINEESSRKTPDFNLNVFIELMKDENLNKDDVEKYVKSCIRSVKTNGNIKIPNSLTNYINVKCLPGCILDRYVKLFERINRNNNVDIEFEYLKYKAKVENNFIDHLRTYIIKEYPQIRTLLNKFKDSINETKQTLDLLFHPDKVKDVKMKDQYEEIFKEVQNIFSN